MRNKKYYDENAVNIIKTLLLNEGNYSATIPRIIPHGTAAEYPADEKRNKNGIVRNKKYFVKKAATIRKTEDIKADDYSATIPRIIPHSTAAEYETEYLRNRLDDANRQLEEANRRNYELAMQLAELTRNNQMLLGIEKIPWWRRVLRRPPGE